MKIKIQRTTTFPLICELQCLIPHIQEAIEICNLYKP